MLDLPNLAKLPIAETGGIFLVIINAVQAQLTVFPRTLKCSAWILMLDFWASTVGVKKPMQTAATTTKHTVTSVLIFARF